MKTKKQSIGPLYRPFFIMWFLFFFSQAVHALEFGLQELPRYFSAIHGFDWSPFAKDPDDRAKNRATLEQFINQTDLWDENYNDTEVKLFRRLAIEAYGHFAQESNGELSEEAKSAYDKWSKQHESISDKRNANDHARSLIISWQNAATVETAQNIQDQLDWTNQETAAVALVALEALYAPSREKPPSNTGSVQSDVKFIPMINLGIALNERANYEQWREFSKNLMAELNGPRNDESIPEHLRQLISNTQTQASLSLAKASKNRSEKLLSTVKQNQASSPKDASSTDSDILKAKKNSGQAINNVSNRIEDEAQEDERTWGEILLLILMGFIIVVVLIRFLS